MTISLLCNKAVYTTCHNQNEENVYIPTKINHESLWSLLLNGNQTTRTKKGPWKFDFQRSFLQVFTSNDRSRQLYSLVTTSLLVFSWYSHNTVEEKRITASALYCLGCRSLAVGHVTEIKFRRFIVSLRWSDYRLDSPAFLYINR